MRWIQHQMYLKYISYMTVLHLVIVLKYAETYNYE